jgi:hypothetical protein
VSLGQDTLYIFWIEEVLWRYHSLAGHHEAVGIFLIASQGSEELVEIRG